jgi:hypothetical protein
MASGLGELVPNVEPSRVVLVDALATDLELNALDKGMANPVEPPEADTPTRGSRGLGNNNIRELHLEVGAMNEITIPGNGACNLLSKIGSTVEGVLDRFETEGRIPSINYLEDVLYQFVKIGMDFISSRILIPPTTVKSLNLLHACAAAAAATGLGAWLRIAQSKKL